MKKLVFAALLIAVSTPSVAAKFKIAIPPYTKEMCYGNTTKKLPSNAAVSDCITLIRCNIDGKNEKIVDRPQAGLTSVFVEIDVAPGSTLACNHQRERKVNGRKWSSKSGYTSYVVAYTYPAPVVGKKKLTITPVK